MNQLFLIKNKLPLMFFVFAASISIFLGGLAQYALSTSTRSATEASLTHFVTHKSESLVALFTEVNFDLQLLSENPFTLASIAALTQEFSTLGTTAKDQLQFRFIEENPFPAGEKQNLETSKANDGYDAAHADAHSFFRILVEEKGYYDVFLIDADGNIVYSVFKELDYATNLRDGEYADSGLGRAFSQAMTLPRGESAFDSFAPYAPSYMAPAAFLSAPLFDAQQNRIGVLAVQLPVDRINNSLLADEWLGDTGKVLLIDADYRLHGAWARDTELNLLDRVTETTAARSGVSRMAQYFDDTRGIAGNRVVAATSSVSYNGTTWGIIVEGDRALLYSAVNRTRNTLVIASLLMTAAMCAIGYFIASGFTKPLTEIGESLNGMAEGNYDVSLASTNRTDEFGTISNSVEALRSKLEAAKNQEALEQESAKEQAFVVDQLTTGLTKLREGDLTYNIHDHFPEAYDSLRIDFNKSIETLNHALAQVVESADSISRGSSEISQASDDLSNRTENQAATLEETAAALDELTASVKSAADGAKSVENIVSEAKEEATQSGEVVQSAVDAMNEIETSSDQISQIIGVIDDIAFQTNLLALNAGVEAARAGESGKGFSVVASEVRALAQRSSEAAHEIKSLISGSAHQVERGVELVGKAGHALETIAERVNNIATLVSDIASGASEQSAGLGEINIGVNQLDQVTQRNAAMVEQATAASHLLQKDTSILADLVANFSIKSERSSVLLDMDEDDGPANVSMVYDEAVVVPAKPIQDRAASGTTDAVGWQDF